MLVCAGPGNGTDPMRRPVQRLGGVHLQHLRCHAEQVRIDAARPPPPLPSAATTPPSLCRHNPSPPQTRVPVDTERVSPVATRPGARVDVVAPDQGDAPRAWVAAVHHALEK